jgi:hypothetical protein
LPEGGQGETKAGPAALAGIDGDIPAMEVGAAADDHETEAGTLDPADIGSPVERFEEAGAVLIGDADATVGDLDDEEVGLAPHS